MTPATTPPPILRMPEGATLTMHVYVIDDDRDLNAEIKVGGFPVFPTEFSQPIDIARLQANGLLPAGNWRVMTRAEIAEYRAEQDDE